MKSKISVAIIVAPLFLLIFSYAGQALAQKSPYDWALIHLDYARNEKAKRLKRFTERLHEVAQRAARDKRLFSFYELNQHYFNALNEEQRIPSPLEKDIEKVRKSFDSYYISEYFIFYDILFVNNDGVVFYTIRKENDLYADLIKQKNEIGPLAEVIASKPEHEVFVDFYYYQPSAEPAAFFVEPVFNEGARTGWIVFQCSINKLNSIFASTDDLGQTGETFLVNKNGLMLTESYFKGNSTILKQHLDDRNIKPKFNARTGHRVVTDYRGETALSSFEVFEFLGSKWLVVAKIDKDEVTTNYYRNHKKYFQDSLLNQLKKQTAFNGTGAQHEKNVQTYRVDMDEFLKADNGQILETWGVSTCTAFVAKVPGRFAYLAHLSSKDKMHNGNETDLLAQITKKIQSFDIYPYEFKKVKFIIVAPHVGTIPNIIDHLMKSGFFLSQIEIACNPLARSAALTYDYKKDVLRIKWNMETNNGQTNERNSGPMVNVIEIIENIILHM